MFSQIFMLAVFCLTYYFILSNKFKTSVMVFLMGLFVSFTKIVDNMTIENLPEFIDFNTIGLLAGMMIIVGLLKAAGFFQFVAVMAVKWGNGNIRKTLSIIVITVALLSAFLDNVTTVLIFAPILFFISDAVGIDATYLMVSAIVASNIGGAATMIGDPPNIIIGSASKLSFTSFIVHLAPICVLILILLIMLWFRKIPADKSMEDKLKQLAATDPKAAIIDKKRAVALLCVFLAVIIGFSLHKFLDYEMALISMAGATISLLIFGKSFEEATKEIEWDTLFFLIGLFMITYAMKEVGIIDYITKVVSAVHSPYLILTVLIWLSGFASMFLSAVPTTTVMIPVVQSLVQMGVSPTVWWALSLGASLGANGTTIGAAVNIVGIALLKKYSNKVVSFGYFARKTMPMTLLILCLVNLYVVLMYYISW
ncbi:MAG TPA: SLC13 family permease [Pseudothermotoga sp.]